MPQEVAIDEGAKASGLRLELKSTTPPPPSFFYGRNEYILNLVELIKRGQERSFGSRITIKGPGGVGKTTVAIALLNHPDIKSLFMDRIHFASCEAAASESLLLEAIASCLGLSKGSNDILSRITESLQGSFRPVFLVLDNFETCWFSDRQFGTLQVLKRLADLRNLTLLLTMRGRDEPPEIRWKEVPELGTFTLENARELFIKIAGWRPVMASSVDKQVNELLQELDCLPLAVTLLAQLSERGESIQRLHHLWTQQKTGLLNLGREDRHHSLDVSIRLSLELGPMRADEYAPRLLRIVAYLPDGIPAGTVEGLTSLFSAQEAYRASSTIRSVSLAYEDSDETLKCLSPLIRYHVVNHTPLEEVELEAIHQFYLRLADIAAKAVNEDIEVHETMRQLKPHLGNLHHVLGELAKGPVVSDTAQEAILQVTKYMYLYSVPSPDLLTKLLANENLTLSNSFIAESTYTLGMIHHMFKKFGPALEALTKAADMFATLKIDRRLAACEWTRGDILRTQCQFSEAKEVLQRAEAAYDALDDRREANDGIAISLCGLADIASVRGELADARLLLQRAQELADSKDDSLHTMCRIGLASVDKEQGNFQKAARTFDAILRDCRITGDPHDIGQCLFRLCKALLHLEKYDEARIYAEEGRDIHDHWEVFNNCVGSLAYVALHEGEYEEAETLFSQAIEAFKGYDDRLGVADTQLGLAGLLFKKGQVTQAAAMLDSLLVEYKTIEHPRGVAQVFIFLAMIHKGDSTRAAQISDQLKEAEATFAHLGHSAYLEVCRSLMSSLGIGSSAVAPP